MSYDTYEGVPTHPTCANSKSPRQLCPSCLHWDPRPEEGGGPGIGYCARKDLITRIRCECDVFEEATPMRVEAKNRAIYGQINEEEEGEE
jgi:hypothetical protein